MPWGKPIPPIPARERIVDKETGQFSFEARLSLERLWAWVAPGFVTIPCTATGTDVITLTPIQHKTWGQSGWSHLLPVSFVAANTSTGTVTMILGELTAVAVYVATAAAGVGDVVADTPYIGIYCDATDALPARVVIK